MALSLLLSPLVSLNSELAKADEFMKWERIPLQIPLQVGLERVVFVDKNVRVGFPPALNGKLRVQSTGGAVYLKADSAFPQTRVQLNDVRDRQKTLDKQNADLLKENEQLRKRGTNVSGQVDEAVQGLRKEYDKRQQQLQNEQTSLLAKVQALSEQLKTTGSGSAGVKPASDSDIPLGLGLDGLGGSTSGTATRGDDGLMWVTPGDQKTVDPRDAASGKASPQFPTSFLDNNPLTRQKAAYEQQVKGHTNEKGAQDSAEPVYTLPENSTLVGSRAMTALLGRIPINGTVTDPYPFKVLIGKDNLTANGIELPDVEGAIVSGSASGDWTLSCVRGQVNSITFVFADGTVRTVPQPDASGKNTGNGNTQNKTGTDGGIGWISDNDGIPCISGTRQLAIDYEDNGRRVRYDFTLPGGVSDNGGLD
ncbi:TPA: TIGR03752 family integrating conjugative element protein [Escherichia coli]|nr:TIGR03752 family integrating conjugative element protein [Escherichia coli]